MASGPAELVPGVVGDGARVSAAVSAADAARADAVNTNGVVFWPVAVIVLLADLATKALAEAALGPAGFAHRIVGDVVRLNLVYNPGAAFGLTLGPYSRAIFLALTVVILRALWALYRTTRDRDDKRVLALALLAGGAVGNAVDRVRSSMGVVDFLDVGVGPHRWPTFNLADVAVTTGAVLLFSVLWRDEHAGAERPPAAPTSTDASETA
jgi:signal peptidase II